MITEFTPVSALVGGMLIGFSAVLLMLGLGRIAGISGIIRGLFTISFSEAWWRFAFLAGLILSPYLYTKLTGVLPEFAVTSNLYQLIGGGLLVGIGTSLGNGCTSGHGVCGISLFSRRSFAATILFMVSAIMTVFVMRHVV